MDKLYNDSYLKKTTEFINHIKMNSYDILEIKDDDILLEIGCGNGYDAIELSKRVGNAGKVYGIDAEERLIEKAKQNAFNNKCNNVEFIISDAEYISFGDNFFNNIRAERLFQHLKNPYKVIEEALRVLKPGGKILLIETDWYGMNLYINNEAVEQKIIDSLLKKVLINGYASRNLFSYLEASGMNDIKMAVYPVLIDNYSVANELIKFDNIIKIGLQEHLIDQKDIDEWNKSINYLSEKKCFNLTTNMLFVWGTK